MTKPEMQHPLGADQSADEFPDFRNLGVVTRTLLWVNAAMLLVAVVKADSVSRLLALVIESAAYVEPVLMVMLVLLYFSQPVLKKIRPQAALGVVLVVACILNLAMVEAAGILGGEVNRIIIFRA